MELKVAALFLGGRGGYLNRFTEFMHGHTNMKHASIADMPHLLTTVSNLNLVLPVQLMNKTELQLSLFYQLYTKIVYFLIHPQEFV